MLLLFSESSAFRTNILMDGGTTLLVRDGIACFEYTRMAPCHVVKKSLVDLRTITPLQRVPPKLQTGKASLIALGLVLVMLTCMVLVQPRPFSLATSSLTAPCFLALVNCLS